MCMRVCVFFFFRIFRSVSPVSLCIYHKLHPRNIAHANNSVNVDQRHWQQQHRSHYYCYSKSLSAIVNWKNVCIRTYNRMKELAKKYAICVAHLDTQHTAQTRNQLYAVAYLECLCTTAIAEYPLHTFHVSYIAIESHSRQSGLILMMQKVWHP